tara:strand:- start:1397 stop:1633 length:237 start_codon:yes stop_codon:yes gene_type:complete
MLSKILPVAGNEEENDKILGLDFGFFLLLFLLTLVFFIYALYLVITSKTISDFIRVFFIISLLFSGPLQLIFSIVIPF